MATCKFCGDLIHWRKTATGAWQPVNLDGSLHFPTCRERVKAGREAVKAWYRELGWEVVEAAPQSEESVQGED